MIQTAGRNYWSEILRDVWNNLLWEWWKHNLLEYLQVAWRNISVTVGQRGCSASQWGVPGAQRTSVCQDWVFGACFFFCSFCCCLEVMCSAVSPSCTDVPLVPVSAAWRSTCCPTARSGSTSATSAPKLSTGSPTWYGTKCRMTAASTTSVRTVPRYSEFVGCFCGTEHMGSAGGGLCEGTGLLQCLFLEDLNLHFVNVSFLPLSV